jgi:enoyl-CoA hydratase/carnithine racemase
MTSELLRAFSEAIERARVDRNVRVVVITAKVCPEAVPRGCVCSRALSCTRDHTVLVQGANFCAGADFKGQLGSLYSATGGEEATGSSTSTSSCLVR